VVSMVKQTSGQELWIDNDMEMTGWPCGTAGW